jgi:hypothetical protein
MLTRRLVHPCLQRRRAAVPALVQAVQLTRGRGNGRLYAIEGVGRLRLTGWTSRAGTAEAGGRSWQIVCHGIWQPVVQASDATGDIVGEGIARTPHDGATLRWSDRELALRADGLWRDRYILVDGDRRLATIDGRGSGRRPLGITADAAAEIEPGLLLFAIFVARALAHRRRPRRRRHRRG